jgi:hypothetical protein
MYLYLKCSVKGGTQNTNSQVINQHRNDTCQRWLVHEPRAWA